MNLKERIATYENLYQDLKQHMEDYSPSDDFYLCNEGEQRYGISISEEPDIDKYLEEFYSSFGESDDWFYLIIAIRQQITVPWFNDNYQRKLFFEFFIAKLKTIEL